MNYLTVFAALVFLFSHCARAEDFFDPIQVNTDSDEKGTSGLDTSAFIKQKFVYGLDTPDPHFAFERDSSGPVQLQSDAFLEIKGNLNSIWKAQFSVKGEMDWLQWNDGELGWKINHTRLFLKDAFLDASFDNGVWLRAGHQIFAWGESEGLNITDIISPSDFRKFGQVELRDVREQVPALMLALPLSHGKLTLVGTVDAGHNRYADASEEFYPYIALKDSGIAIDTKAPATRYETALRYEFSFNGGDASIVAGDMNNNEFSLHLDDKGLQRRQERVSVIGMAANRALGAWLWRGELGHYWNQPVLNSSAQSSEQNQLRMLAGMDYSGWTDWTLSLEVNTLAVLDQESSAPAAASEDSVDLGHVLRLRNEALNGRLVQQFWSMGLLADNGSIYRYDLGYDLSDRWELTLALVIYSNKHKNSQLYAFRNQDACNLAIQYSF